MTTASGGLGVRCRHAASICRSLNVSKYLCQVLLRSSGQCLARLVLFICCSRAAQLGPRLWALKFNQHLCMVCHQYPYQNQTIHLI